MSASIAPERLFAPGTSKRAKRACPIWKKRKERRRRQVPEGLSSREIDAAEAKTVRRRRFCICGAPCCIISLKICIKRMRRTTLRQYPAGTSGDAHHRGGTSAFIGQGKSRLARPQAGSHTERKTGEGASETEHWSSLENFYATPVCKGAQPVKEILQGERRNRRRWHARRIRDIFPGTN